MNRRQLRRLIMEELSRVNEESFDADSSQGMIDSFIEWAHKNGIGKSLTGRSNPDSPLFINIPNVGKFEIVAQEE